MNSLPKLICVDDDPSVLVAIKRLLNKDFEILPARSASEALALIDAHPDVAIVLSDQKLAGSDTGLQLLSAVQVKAPDSVRAIFSGYLNASDLVDAINTARIHRLILKPWDNDYFRVQMIEALANHSTLRERSQLQALSVTDPVTSLKNHRYFQDRLRIEVERGMRHGRTVSLAMIDIDHFKQFNDKYGHPAGDVMLRMTSLRLLDQVRSIDTVARYGGEEFAVIMPDTDHGQAMRVAERIRLSVGDRLFQLPNLPEIKLTISLGVATLPDHATTAQDLVESADRFLYRAKGQGRNQVIGA